MDPLVADAPHPIREINRYPDREPFVYVARLGSKIPIVSLFFAVLPAKAKSYRNA